MFLFPAALPPKKLHPPVVVALPAPSPTAVFFTPVVSAYAHPIASFYAEAGVATGDNNHWIFGKLITDIIN